MLLKKKHGFSTLDVDHREFRLKGIITEEVSFDHEPPSAVGRTSQPACDGDNALLQLSAVIAFKI